MEPSRDELLEQLRHHRMMQNAPPEELEWLIDRGEYQRIPAGHTFLEQNPEDRREALGIIFSGRISISVDRGAGVHKVMEWRGGDITGLLPYSRMTRTPGASVVEETVEFLSVSAEHFREMIRECHGVTTILVHHMLDRARRFTSSDLHDEKMLSLGRLAAGLAHELNNPASAIVSTARQLAAGLDNLEESARHFGAVALNDEQEALVDSARRVCLSSSQGTRSPIEHAQREDELADWLLDHVGDDSAAPQLAETSITPDVLEKLAAHLEPQALKDLLRSIGVGCSMRTLAGEIERAAERIVQLVSAVKGFTYMDQTATPQPTDVARGLRDTVAVHASMAREKKARVEVHIADDLPAIEGFGGELNQVWANLISNAIDAVETGGSIVVSAECENDNVVVRVIDDGPGIPPEIANNVFDPFFTTKPVGKGTGLGLDIARRLVVRHHGHITADSQPGRTEFRVTLPVTTQSG